MQFSKTWVEISRTRIIIAVGGMILISVFAFSINLKLIGLVGTYIIFYLLTYKIPERFLQGKLASLLRHTNDTLFITLAIYIKGGGYEHWFLLYYIPIFFVSRSIGYWGSLPIASESAIAYLLLQTELFKVSLYQPTSFFIETISFFVIAIIGGSLSRIDRKGEQKIFQLISEIERAIISDVEELDKVLRLILTKAIAITSSQGGYIKMYNSENFHRAGGIVFGECENPNWEFTNLDKIIVSDIRRTKETLILSKPQMVIRNRRMTGKYSSAVYIPIIQGGVVTGNIALFHPGYFHFSKSVAGMVETLASFVVLTIERSNLQNERKTLFEEFVQNSPDPIVALDRNGKIEIFNTACESLLGWNVKDVLGQSVLKLYKNPDIAKEIGNKLKVKKPVINIEVEIIDKDGMAIPVSLSAVPKFKARSEYCGSIGVFKDLRAIKQLNEQEKFAAFGRLAPTIGHTIKTKAGTVRNYIGVLFDEIDKNKEPELYKIYGASLSAINDIIENIKTLLTGGVPSLPEKKKMLISEIISIIKCDLDGVSCPSWITRDMENSSADFKLDLDIRQIIDVFHNLFSNSIFALELKRKNNTTFQHGLIKLTLHYDKDKATITWEDNGMGISKNDLENIFQAFFTKKESGTGLGLYIVQTIIQNHEGHIYAKSKLGEGTKFIITLPIYQE